MNDLNDFEKKNNEGNESKTNISTENEESQISDISKLDEGKSQTSEIDIEQDDLDDSFEEDINKIDLIKFENDKLINEIRCKIKKEKSNNKNNSKSNNNNDNTVSKVINSLEESLPNDEKSMLNECLKDLADIHKASEQKKKNKKKKIKIKRIRKK